VVIKVADFNQFSDWKRARAVTQPYKKFGID